ncbi:MAG: hypothetical protein KBS82_08475 [Oscillospiraceae bacterium]|nr:hypothetical protein [Candidatus Limimonas egerieequi]
MQKKLSLPVLIVNGILIVAAFAASMYVIFMESAPMFQRIYSAIDLLILGFGFFYFINGYKKDAASFYKYYTLLFAFRIFLSVISVDALFDVNGIGGFPLKILMALLPYTPVLILALVKDLGKKKSFTLSGIVFAWYFLCLVATIVISASGSLNVLAMLNTMNLIKSGTMVVFSALLVVMTIAKYQDKDARGTK